MNEISEDGVRMESGIADDIGHPGLLPASELLCMTVSAGVRANKVSGLGRGLRDSQRGGCNYGQHCNQQQFGR